MRVLRVATLPLSRKVPLLRGLEQFTTAFVVLCRALITSRHDAVIIYSPPLTFAITGFVIRLIRRTPFVLNVQDLYPQTPIQLGLLRNRLLIRFSNWLERFAYKRANRIIVHSDDNLQHVVNVSKQPDKTASISNWVDTDSILPSNRDNSFRREHDAGARIVVSFAGVMGFAQGLDAVVDAARILFARTDIRFLLIGDGVIKARLEQRVHELGLSNVTMLPMQTSAVYGDILAASDICLVSLTPELKTPVVPAKLQSIMAAGRPVIASVDARTGVPEIIKQARCGVVTDPSDPKALATAIEKLADEPETRAAMGAGGRDFALEHYSLDTAIDRYVAELEQIVGVR